MAVTWTAGGNVNTAVRAHASFGTLAAGAYSTGTASSATAATEEYNGTSWSTGNNSSTAAEGFCACGTQTAGLMWAGGTASTGSQEYDGTNWASGDTLPGSLKQFPGSVGGQSAAVSAGGGDASTNGIVTTYLFNGSSWSTGNDLSANRYQMGSLGTTTAFMVTGGNNSSNATLISTEKFNGSSWSSGGDMVDYKRGHASGGTTTNGLAAFGAIGWPTAVKTAFLYNGSSWSSGTDGNAARTAVGVGPGGSTGVISAGYSGGNINTSEEYDLGESETTTSTSSSTSTTTSTTISPTSGGLAFGEETPDSPESAISWATWGGTGSISGDAAWGKLELDFNEYGYSRVYSFGDSQNRQITLTNDKYGAGQGSATLQIRGQNTIFAVNAAEPSWENYTGATTKDWQFIQVKFIYQ